MRCRRHSRRGRGPPQAGCYYGPEGGRRSCKRGTTFRSQLTSRLGPPFSAWDGALGPATLATLLRSRTQALARPDSAEHAARRAATFRERFQPRAILARAAAGPLSRPPALSGASGEPSGTSGEGTSVPPRGPLGMGSAPSQPGPLPDARALPHAPVHEMERAAACRPGTTCCKRHPRVRTCTFS